MPSFEIQSAVNVERLFALKIQRPESTRLGLKLFPVKKQEVEKIVYERDQIRRGIQASRGSGGPLSRVQLPGFTSFSTDPSYYGEFIRFTEEDMQRRRLPGDWFKPATVDKLENLASDYLAGRYLDRREKNVFDILQTGGFQSVDAFGNVTWQTLYAITTATAGTPWTTVATCTPLADLRAAIVTFEFGKSVDFRSGEIWMNRNTVNQMLLCQNANDLKGSRIDNGSTVNSLGDEKTGFNVLLIANDLPPIRIYDENYYADGTTTTATRFIGDGKAIFVGKRTDGVPMGSYVMTPAVQGGGKAGEWFIVEDRRTWIEPSYTVAAGHNGAPVLEYPEAVAAFTCY